ncbi:MAG: hypothetical protein DRO67_00075 [Candidatus Asgardarchaeum californiense]|nr:MAG: hypothetical protein DRO67_00075 [Candidatus Asgardarchaeum californiense]
MKFKVGDKVRLIKESPFSKSNCLSLGKIYTVTKKSKDNSCIKVNNREWFIHKNCFVPSQEVGEGSMEFRVGDKVRLVSEGSWTINNGLILGEVYTVALISSDKSCIRVYGKEAFIGKERFELFQKAESKREQEHARKWAKLAEGFEIECKNYRENKMKTNNRKSWKFKVSSKEALHYNEIGETLNKDRLIAITTTDDPTKGCAVYVHNRIMVKSHQVGIELPSYNGMVYEMPCGHVAFILRHADSIKKITKWVKEVRTAKWENQENLEVTVRYPEL